MFFQRDLKKGVQTFLKKTEGWLCEKEMLSFVT